MSTTRTTPRHVDPTFVRDLALCDVRDRHDDIGNLFPPSGAHVTPECVSDVYVAYRRLGTAINRLNEAHERVMACSSRQAMLAEASDGPDVALNGWGSKQ